jgi:23S rRNA (adenine2503-C2)-methyltransferase
MTLLQLPPAEVEPRVAAWLAEHGEPAYRLRQIIPRLWQRPVADWQEATDLPASLRHQLDRDFPLPSPSLVAEQRSSDGTVKFLWDFGRDGAVESVLIPEGRRKTLCISSQVGCAFGCVFCATGRMGFVRHLAAWEIAAQVRELLRRPEYGIPTNIVFMGMGEPLHNWAAVDTALSILNHPRGCGIGARRITVSTVGLIPALQALAARPEQFRVALSLHATTHEQRARLMPVERKYRIEEVIEALRDFPRRVTFEYVMIAAENDSLADADRLAHLAHQLGAHVNLLPLHPGGAGTFAPSPAPTMRAFAAALVAAGVNTTIRISRGLDIAAACGQLRTEVQHRGVSPQ